jgi:hypothetical protein
LNEEIGVAAEVMQLEEVPEGVARNIKGEGLARPEFQIADRRGRSGRETALSA